MKAIMIEKEIRIKEVLKMESKHAVKISEKVAILQYFLIIKLSFLMLEYHLF